MKQLDLVSYFNTVHEAGKTLKEYEEKAGYQEKEVIAIFKLYPAGTLLCADDVHYHMIEASNNDIPITSTRRAITNLTTKGLLEKTAQKKLGSYGRLTYCWKIKENESSRT